MEEERSWDSGSADGASCFSKLEGNFTTEFAIHINLASAHIGVADLVELLDGNIVSKSFKKFLATDFHKTIAKKIGKANAFDPTDVNTKLATAVQAEPVYPENLHRLMQQPVGCVTVRASKWNRPVLELQLLHCLEQ